MHLPFKNSFQFLASDFEDMPEKFLAEMLSFQTSIKPQGNSVPIVFCADENYARYLPVMIQSIIEHASNKHFYHIIIFDCNENRNLVDSSLHPVLKRQLADKPNFSLHVINICPLLKKYSQEFKSSKADRFPPAIFGRLFVPDLLPMFDKAIYSDLDAIYQSDIGALMSLDLGSQIIAAPIDVQMNINRMRSRHVKKHISQTLKLADDTFYVCAGLLVFNIKAWQENNILDKIIDFLKSVHLNFAEQDALNFVCQGKILYLDQKYGCMTLEDDHEKLPLSNAILAHYGDLIAEYRQANMSETTFIQFVGPVKPWFSLGAIKADLWWSYCRKTEIYGQLLLDACERLANPQKYKREEKEFRFLFLPLFKIKTWPDLRLYKLFGLTIAKRIQTKNHICYYILGLNLFTVKVRST